MIMQTIFEICIIPLLGILTKFLIDFLEAKRKEINAKTDSEIARKYTNMIAETVKNCVKATNQTYVDSLKDTDAFDKEAQLAALKNTIDSIYSILSDDSIQYLEQTTEDIEVYLRTLVEAEVARQK